MRAAESNTQNLGNAGFTATCAIFTPFFLRRCTELTVLIQCSFSQEQQMADTLVAGTPC